jgi:hypothetical protein
MQHAFASYELVGRVTGSIAPIRHMAHAVKCFELIQILALMRAIERTVTHAANEPVVRIPPHHTIPVSLLFPGTNSNAVNPEGECLLRDRRTIVEVIDDNALCEWIILVVSSWISTHPPTERAKVAILLQTFASSDINERRDSTVFLLVYQRLFSTDHVLNGYTGSWGVLVHMTSWHAVQHMVQAAANRLSEDRRNDWVTAAVRLHASEFPKSLPVLLQVASMDMGLPAEVATLKHHQLLVFIYLATTVQGQQLLQLWSTQCRVSLAELPTIAANILTASPCLPRPQLL